MASVLIIHAVDHESAPSIAATVNAQRARRQRARLDGRQPLPSQLGEGGRDARGRVVVHGRARRRDPGARAALHQHAAPAAPDRSSDGDGVVARRSLRHLPVAGADPGRRRRAGRRGHRGLGGAVPRGAPDLQLAGLRRAPRADGDGPRPDGAARFSRPRSWPARTRRGGPLASIRRASCGASNERDTATGRHEPGAPLRRSHRRRPRVAVDRRGREREPDGRERLRQDDAPPHARHAGPARRGAGLDRRKRPGGALGRRTRPSLRRVRLGFVFQQSNLLPGAHRPGERCASLPGARPAAVASHSSAPTRSWPGSG